MKTNEEMIFDELMRQKLGNYSESPDMGMMNNILAKKNRIMKLYRLSKIFSVICVAGLSLLVSYMMLKPADIMTDHTGKIFKANQYATINNSRSTSVNLGYPSADFTSTISVAQVENAANHSSPFTIQNSVNNNPGQPHFLKNSASANKPNSKTGLNEINVKSSVPDNSLKTENTKSVTEKAGVQKAKKKEISNACKAAFDYYVSYDGKYNFTNFSDASSGATMFWDFGDGTTSDLSSPYHIYKNKGSYLVTLTISDIPNSCSDTYQKNIIAGIALNQQNQGISVKGRVIAGSEPLENGSVNLMVFNTEKNAYILLAKSNTSLSGEYSFSSLKTGTYLILADANSNKFVPTYWGNTTEINDAIEVHVMENDHQDLTGFNINLTNNKAMNSNDVARIFANDTGSRTTFLILDQNNNVIGIAMVDHNGNPNLSGFPPGNYNVLNQQTGNTSSVTVTSSNTFVGNLNAGAVDGSMTLIPNPAFNNVKFNINVNKDDQQVEIVIINSNGSTVYRRNYTCTSGAYPFDIDISGLPPGEYHVLVKVGGTQTMGGTLIKSSDNSKY